MHTNTATIQHKIVWLDFVGMVRVVAGHAQDTSRSANARECCRDLAMWQGLRQSSVCVRECYRYL